MRGEGVGCGAKRLAARDARELAVVAARARRPRRTVDVSAADAEAAMTSCRTWTTYASASTSAKWRPLSCPARMYPATAASHGRTGPRRSFRTSGGPIERLAHDEARAVGVGAKKRCSSPKTASKRSSLAVAASRSRGSVSFQCDEDALEHGLADVLLRGEVVQHGGLGHAHRVGDVLERRAVEAVGREEARGRRDDGGAGVGLDGSGGYHVDGRHLPSGKLARKPPRR